MTDSELHQLIHALLDGVISEADHLRLEAELLVNPQSRQIYYDALEVDGLLEEEADAVQQAAVIVPFWKQSWVRVGAAVAAVFLVLGVILPPYLRHSGGATASGTELQASGFAVISGQVDAIWQNGRQFREGDLLPAGSLQMKSGLVQFELFSGVSVILEGASEFEIHSAMELEVTQGKLRVQVPPAAKGFRVRTADGEVVDLGTEFAMEVAAEGAELHVMDGEVEWHPAGAEMKSLTEGEALRWQKAGNWEALPSDSDRFVAHTDLESRLQAGRMNRLEQWQVFSRELRKDPRLIAYYPMDQPGTWNRKLFNEAEATQDREQDGAIVAASRVTGRWDYPKSALDFSPTGSRVRVNIPGEYRSLTFACWVRIDSLDRWYNSLFLTDAYDIGEPHWQIMDDGRLFFCIKARDKKRVHHMFYSPSFWDPTLSGKWLHLATTYDVDAKLVRHYLNGEILSEEVVPDEMLVEVSRFGSASIGNWSEPQRDDPHFAVRNLNGSIDELMIFSGALQPQELAELYEKGKP